MRIPLTVLVLVVGSGCSSDAMGLGDLASLLGADSVGKADLNELTSLSLTPDGEPLPVDDAVASKAVRDLDVVAADDRLGVSVRGGAVELIVWVDRADAASWTRREAVGGARPGGSGVTLDATELVEILDARGDATYVGIERDKAWFEIWLDASDVDQVRTSEPTADWPEVRATDFTFVTLNTEILDGPGGQVLGGFREGGRQLGFLATEPESVGLRGASKDGFTPIEWTDQGLRVEGWVADAAILSDYAPPLRGRGAGGSYGSSHCGSGYFSSWPVLPAGTPVYADIDGEIIGKALEDEPIGDFRLGPEIGFGWRTLRVETELGPITVWLAPHALELS